MHDLNCRYVGDHLTYAPRGVSVAEYRYLAASGFWSAQIYWRNEGFPIILHEFFRVPEGEVLEVHPMGSHSQFDAAFFINHRIAEIHDYVVGRAEAGLGMPKFNISKWRLGSVPGSQSDIATPSVTTVSSKLSR